MLQLPLVAAALAQPPALPRSCLHVHACATRQHHRMAQYTVPVLSGCRMHGHELWNMQYVFISNAGNELLSR